MTMLASFLMAKAQYLMKSNLRKEGRVLLAHRGRIWGGLSRGRRELITLGRLVGAGAQLTFTAHGMMLSMHY